MDFKRILQNLLGRKTPPAHVPYIPTPPVHNIGSSAPPNPNAHYSNADNSYTETETDIHTIAGTSIGFGKQKIIRVDQNGQANSFSQAQSHILGSGKLVREIENIVGVCKFCQVIAIDQLQAGQISVEQAQLLSLYDNSSAAICNFCGVQGCIRHIKSMQTESGITTICVTCQQQLKKQARRRKIVNFILSPFIETNEG
jgi:hypothetical protein